MAETITNQVQVYRREKGMTQEELATAVSVSRQTIIAIERGNYVPSVLLALKIAAVFGVATEVLFSISYE